MSDRFGSIQVEGLDKVTQALERCDRETRAAAMKGIQEFGLNVIADAQNNLKSNGSWVTGVLVQSGKVQKDRKGESVDIGFFDTTNRNSGYAFYVEYGRRAGKFPPLDEIRQWVYKKFGMERRDADRVGFVIARKIAEKGTRPHPFFVPAIDKNKGRLEDIVRRILKRKED